MWIKKLLAKIFRREPRYSSDETTIGIAKNILRLSKKNRVNFYNGTVAGLRQAQGDNNSTVFVVEITYPVDRDLQIRFKEYVERLRRIYAK